MIWAVWLGYALRPGARPTFIKLVRTVRLLDEHHDVGGRGGSEVLAVTACWPAQIEKVASGGGPCGQNR
jgi:hypothetical protein